ncbi:MAG: hypothetical protein M0P49_00675 [Bacilli bacterium]|nr:hypothetical protein [Bacilli bacterium]
MMLQNIQTIREAASYEELVNDDALTSQDNQSITLVTENNKIYSSAKDVFIWDDTNSILHVLRSNINTKTQQDKPILFETFGYESISYMRLNSTQSNIDDILELIN